MAFLAVVFMVLLVAAWLAAQPFRAARRRRKLRERTFPPAWREIIHRRIPLFHRLPRDLQVQVEQRVQVFIGEKSFIGCAGLEIDDEVRVTIAAQACLLILNRRTDYFPNLRQILVYPGAFIVERLRPEPSGVLQEHRQALSGESWTQGQVILSWEDTVEGAAVPDDGRNVVIHEFAHQLDQDKGYANGAPHLGRRVRYDRWSRVLGEEFARLQWQAAIGEPSLINNYGAANPAEFFAVVSEVFFEQPQRMAAEHPELYRELRQLYCVDPLAW
jgi:Mlc titration factor MtfA (ptsG expression regulator)